MGDLLAPNGYLARLKAHGYVVLAPNQQDADAGDSTAPATAGSGAR